MIVGMGGSREDKRQCNNICFEDERRGGGDERRKERMRARCSACKCSVRYGTNKSYLIGKYK